MRVCFLVLLSNAASLEVNAGSQRDVVEDASDYLLDARWQTQQMDDLSKEVGDLARGAMNALRVVVCRVAAIRRLSLAQKK